MTCRSDGRKGMKTIVIVLLIILGLMVITITTSVIVFSIRYNWRCNSVYGLRCHIADMASAYNVRHLIVDSESRVSAFSWFYSKWSFDDMLYSNRPLTLEAWYTPEELERIES